ncbi:3'-5' exonuclease [Patescibacteria group bacterium]
MDKQTLQKEKENLKEILSKVEYARDDIDLRLGDIGKDNLDKLKDLRETPETSGQDFFQFLEQIHQDNVTFNIKDKFKRLEELDYLKKDPYFARIDLKDQETGFDREVYIGKFGYTEKVPVITDWRAKVASVYYRYRYPQNNVKYETPDGEVVSDLELKRTFEIDNGNLLKYYNNDIQLDESEIIAEKIEKRTGGVLEDIVESIQESQLDIIEEDPRKLCLVQGCVGSGKSTVAIHKLSHIFFNYPKFIHPDRSILIAKNHVLVSYLSTLFPKLGIFDINYKTIRELIINIVYREKLHVKVDFDELEVGDQSEKRVSHLDKLINEVHLKYEEKITGLFKKEEFETFGGYKYSTDLTPFENISEILEDLDKELANQRSYVKDKPKSIRALLYKENVRVLKKLITNLKKMRLDAKDKVIRNQLKKLGISTESKLSYEQSLIYIYLYLELIGLQKFRKFEYCVIDEGQDLSLLEYSIISKLVLFGRMSVLGDLNQGYSKEGLVSWNKLAKILGKEDSYSLYTLDTNYRSTKPIIDLANKILSPHSKEYLPKSIDRVGEEPKILPFDYNEQMLQEFRKNIEEDVIEVQKSIGIICFDENLIDSVKDILIKSKLDKKKLIELREDKNIVYLPKGVYFTNFENCRGLEFSKVYVLGLNPNNLNSESAAKKAFIAVTRAMNELEVYYIK